MGTEFFLTCSGCGNLRPWAACPHCNVRAEWEAQVAQDAPTAPAPTAPGRYASATLDGFAVKDRPYPKAQVWERSHFDEKADDGRGAWLDQAFPPKQQRLLLQNALLTTRGYVAQPDGWLYLCGNYGSGKTHLAAAAYNALAHSAASAAYWAMAELLTDLRGRMRDHTTDAQLTALAGVELLLLDDLKEEHINDDWSGRTLADLLNARYTTPRATIITSNLPLDALGGRIGSRLAEAATPVVVVAYDYRRLMAAERAAAS